MRDTSTVGEFHSKKCYRLYKEASALAIIVNEKIKDGYDARIGEKKISEFVLRSGGIPVIAIREGVEELTLWFTGVTDVEGKPIWKQVSNKEIKRKFKSIKLFRGNQEFKLIQ